MKKLVFLIALLAVGCTSEEEQQRKPYVVSEVTVDGCEYIVVTPVKSTSSQTGIAIIHKANCKNHKEQK
jgi:uncharacterized protein YcfL